MRIEDIPPRYRGVYRQAMNGRSRRAAIRAHCLMCVGWSQEEVRLCTAPTCPLYRYRLGAVTAESEPESAGETERAESP